MKIIDKTTLDKHQKFWLDEAKNLVTSLSKFYGNITLDKISQKFDDITDFEANLLNTTNSLVRQISLSNSENKFVYARTIVTKNTYQHLYKS